jgi:hypothetical protein
MSDLDEFYVHTVTVETYQGEGSMGPVFAAPATVPGFLDTVVGLSRTATTDNALSAGSMFYCDPTHAALFTVKSRVASSDLGGDGLATVVMVNNLTSGPLGLPDHAEVGLL